MARKSHRLDDVIIKQLQSSGYVKSEAEAYLKQNVYKLKQEEVTIIKNYAEHFGLTAKERVIEDILEVRREAILHKLRAQSVSAV